MRSGSRTRGDLRAGVTFDLAVICDDLRVILEDFGLILRESLGAVARAASSEATEPLHGEGGSNGDLQQGTSNLVI